MSLSSRFTLYFARTSFVKPYLEKKGRTRFVYLSNVGWKFQNTINKKIFLKKEKKMEI